MLHFNKLQIDFLRGNAVGWLTFYYTFPKIQLLMELIFLSVSPFCEWSKRIIFFQEGVI